MCGRYVAPGEADLERVWNLPRNHNPFRRVFNAAPTMLLPVVRERDGERAVVPMRWGLIPSWWSKPEPPQSTINARVEEAATKPMWRSAVKHTRCLVPALGWYEWQAQPGKRKLPHFIHAPDRGLIHFAGLWSSWVRDGEDPVDSFAILTRDASASVEAIHNRMPVILRSSAFGEWLDPNPRDGTAAAALAHEAARTDFQAYPVSSRVNSPRNQGEGCLGLRNGS